MSRVDRRSLLWRAGGAAGMVLAPAQAAKRATLNVFLFAGQSNMAAADSVIADPPGFQATEADRRTLFTSAPVLEGMRSPDYYAWGEVKGHHCRNPRYGDKLVHGPEVGFTRSLYAGGVKNVAIIKVYGNFSREAASWPWAEGGEMHRRWVEFVDARLAELKDRGYATRVRGFVWHQGIDDGIHARLAPQYRENLTALIGALRKRYAKKRTPFVLARSASSPIARRITGEGPDAPMALVRRAQVAVGERVPGAAWIDVDDLPNVVEHHFSAESQLVIGRRFGEAWLKLERR